MGDEPTDLEVKHSWWSSFKHKNHLQVYDVFKRQGKAKGNNAGIKGKWGARFKLIGLNLISAGLCNIYYRAKQDKSRKFKKKGTNYTPIVQNHDVGLERKIETLSSSVNNLRGTEGLYYQFGNDLNFFLRELFDLPREEKTIDNKFPEALQVAVKIEALSKKFEVIGEEAQKRNIDFLN